ncbi:MAG: serine/threonine-protein kinase [Deltaproteobacteria bacterium]|nr:serine/threonine-protein kinase [Deltaproteobacteria bacterium]
MACPTEFSLLQFLEGKLREAALVRLEAHLDNCGTCREVLAHLKDRRLLPGDSSGKGWLHWEGSSIVPGTVVAERYLAVRFIGRGGMGEVYEVEDRLLGTHVALKTVPKNSTEAEGAARRVRREVLLSRKVTHPNVCRVFDIGRHEAALFLTMELLNGETLRQFLKINGPMSTDAAARVVEPLISGLAAAHAAGIIHRDFKCENIMMIRSELGLRPVITDFGLARNLASPDATRDTFAGMFVGTLLYAAPEQLKGTPVTEATDVYSLGLTMYQMLSGGKLPHPSQLPAEVAQARLEQPARSIRDVRPDVDAIWCQVISRCLERDPALRYQTVRAVSRDLFGTYAPRASVDPERSS